MAIFSSSLLVIQPASAITCPSGTSISTTDTTKCISNTATYTPTDKATVYSCPTGTTLSGSNCVTASVWVDGGTYTSTSKHYSPSCSSGTYNSSDQMCHTVADPPLTNSFAATSTTSLKCPSGTVENSNGGCFNTSTFTITSKVNVTTYSCPNGGTLNGTMCDITITEILSSPTSVVDGYYCGTTLQTSSTCTTSGYWTTASSSAAAVSYTGTCSTYMTFSKTDGKCYAYTFAPETPTTPSMNMYQCTITGWGTNPTVAYYNYDASVVAPFGKSITCILMTGTNATNNGKDGVYICNSVNLLTGNIYYYSSDVDATSITTTVATTCDFIETQNVSIEDDQPINSNSDYTCDGFFTFSDYMACLLRQYV